MEPKYYFVLDVESIGLHGEGFAFGYVVIDDKGDVVDFGSSAFDPQYAKGTPADHEWVVANVPYQPPRMLSAPALRYRFWDNWCKWQSQGAVMCADVTWPVEARFLAACIDDDPRRAELAPYPLLDIVLILFAAGIDPLTSHPRLDHELPAHTPLNDARQSARLLAKALCKLRLERELAHSDKIAVVTQPKAKPKTFEQAYALTATRPTWGA